VNVPQRFQESAAEVADAGEPLPELLVQVMPARLVECLEKAQFHLRFIPD
jgi:hypothetical protein